MLPSSRRSPILFLALSLLSAGASRADLDAAARRVSQDLENRVTGLHAGCSHETLGVAGQVRVESFRSEALLQVPLRLVAEDLPRLLDTIEGDAQNALTLLVAAITTESRLFPCLAHGEPREYPAARLTLMLRVKEGRCAPSVTSGALRGIASRFTTNHFLAFGQVAQPKPPRPGDPPPPPPPPPEALVPMLRDLRIDRDGNVVGNFVVPNDRSAVDRLLASIGQNPGGPVPGSWVQGVQEGTEMRRPILQVDLRGALAVPEEAPPEPRTPPPEAKPAAKGAPAKPIPAGAPSAAEIRAAIESTLGAPFAKTGTNPKTGLSPAGLVRYVHARLGIRDLPKATHEIHADSRSPVLPRKGYKPKLGDVLFFELERDGKKMRYPGIMLDPEKRVFVLALANKGVVKMSLADPTWKSRFESAKRFLGP